MMTIKMPESAGILSLIAPDLAIEEAGLGALCTLRAARGEAAPLLKTVGLQEPAQRCIGRHGLEIGVGLGERHEIVVVQLHAPALVRGVLGEDRLAYRAAHRRLLPSIGAQLAPQN